MWELTYISLSLTIPPKACPTHVHFPAIFSSHLCRLESHSAGSPATPSMAGILAGQWQWAGAQTLRNDFWIVLTSKKPLSAGLISLSPFLPIPSGKLLMWMGITAWHKRERLCAHRADLIPTGVFIYLLWFHTSALAIMSYEINPCAIKTHRYVLYIQGGWRMRNLYMQLKRGGDT